MSTTSQMLKGLLEGCLLALIAKGETYGYEIVEKLKEHHFPFVSEGSIYPVLMRLQKNNFVTYVHRQSPNGPKRKYYSITKEGQEELERFKQLWKEVSCGVSSLLEEEE